MNGLQALILSLVEGITEFLPISSTGHLILASLLLGIPQTEFVKSFEIAIQVGAILAVVLLYFKTLLKSQAIWLRILAAFLPTAVIGLVLYKLVKQYLLGNVTITLVMLLLGGIVLIVLEKFYKQQPHHLDHIEKLTIPQAIIIGCFQAISIVPGVSRAGATIVGGLLTGLRREPAVEFSFLLAVPTLLAATVLDLVKMKFAFTSLEYLLLAIGLVGAFASAYLVVSYFIRFVKQHTFIPFGVYRIVLAVVFWIFVK